MATEGEGIVLPGVQGVLLERLTLDVQLQPRREMDPALIDEYAERMDAGDTFPPLIAYLDDVAVLWLSEGWHRYAAARQSGLEVFSVEVRLGSRRDALLNSLASNAMHGQRRSNADKRRAVTVMLLDLEWQHWGDVKIARHLGVDDHTVTKYRRAALPALSSELPKIGDSETLAPQPPLTRLVERNGTTYEMDVSRIGPRQPTLTEALAQGMSNDPSIQRTKRAAALSRAFSRMLEDIASLTDLEQTVAEADREQREQIARNVRWLRDFAEELDRLLSAQPGLRAIGGRHGQA